MCWSDKKESDERWSQRGSARQRPAEHTVNKGLFLSASSILNNAACFLYRAKNKMHTVSDANVQRRGACTCTRTYLGCYRACWGSESCSRCSSWHHHHRTVAPPDSPSRFPRPPLLRDPTGCRSGVRLPPTCSWYYRPPRRCCRRRPPCWEAAALRLWRRGRLWTPCLSLCLLCSAMPRPPPWWRLQLSCGPGTNESSLGRRFLCPLPRSQCRRSRRLPPGPDLCLSPARASLCSCRPESRGLARVNPPASRLLVWAAFLFSPSLWERVAPVPLQSRCSNETRTPEKIGIATSQWVRRRFPLRAHQAPVSLPGWKAQSERPVSRSVSPADAIFLLGSPSVENTTGLSQATQACGDFTGSSAPLVQRKSDACI